MNSQIRGDLHVFRSEQGEQVILLDKDSEVSGNVIFDDNRGVVIVRGKSKVDGKIIGGKIQD